MATMALSLVIATALWFLPVWLAFLGPNRSGWQATAMALLLPVSFLALLVSFLLLEPLALGGGAFSTLVVVLIVLLTRGGKPGRSVAWLLLLVLSPALLLCLMTLWAAWAFAGMGS